MDNRRFIDRYTGATLYGKTVPIKELVGEIERQKVTKRDYVVDSRNLRMQLTGDMNDTPSLCFDGPTAGPDVKATMMFEITPWCHDQISAKTGIPLKYYQRMAADNRPLLCQNVNAWMPSKDQRMVRTLDGRARALLSDRFRVLDNADLFFNSAKVFQDVGAEILRADLSDTMFYMRAIQPVDVAEIAPGDEICSGVMMSNSEVGLGTLKVEAFCLRLKCSNGMVATDIFKRAHLGSKLEVGVYTQETINMTSRAIMSQAKDYVAHAFKMLDQWKAILTNSMNVELPSPTKLVKGGWDGIDVSDEDKDTIMNHLMTDNEGMTQFGFSQAVTATARDVGDADHKTELERLGFRLVSLEKEPFGRLMEQAIRVKHKRLEIEA